MGRDMRPLPHTKPNFFVEKIYTFFIPRKGGVGGARGGTPLPPRGLAPAAFDVIFRYN